MSKIHVLKTWPGPFEAMRAGRKTFEYRMNDRDFEVGDCLVLQEYNPEYDSLTRECISMRVTYLLNGGQFGIPPKYCVMSVEPWESAPCARPAPCGRCGGDGWLRCADADCLVCMADNYCADSTRCPNACPTTRAKSEA